MKRDTFRLTLDTGNAAFDDADDDASSTAAAYEIARILRETAKRLENGQRSGPLYDCNGNRVGAFEAR